MRTPLEIETRFATRDMLDGVTSFFLVGIGGAGMSGVARLLKRRGFAVRGVDATDSDVLQALVEEGIEASVGSGEPWIASGGALVLTDAVDLSTSAEVRAATLQGVPLFRRSQVLGWLLRDHKCICVTGTHGKTTTTGLIGAGLRAAGLDPTIIVGAEVPEWGGSIVEGKSDWAVIEACEAYDSLRDFDPYIAVLTNLELDHVDFHGDWPSLQRAMIRFLQRIPPDGTLIVCTDDQGAMETARDIQHCKVVEYDTHTWSELTTATPLVLAGSHNQANAGAALMACFAAKSDEGLASEGISKFRGAERRLQVLLDGAIKVIDDYAHTPREIEASLAAMRERYPGSRLVVAYQPHLYSRTQGQFNSFAQALSGADLVFLTDIYPAREDPIPGVSSARIVELVSGQVRYIANRRLLPRAVAAMVQPGDVVVGMGAGDISAFAPEFIQELQRTPASGSLKVAVVYGGDSPEREISILTGREVHAALRAKGHEAELVDISELLLSGGDCSRFVGPNRPHAAFLCVHGTHAEDGAIQGFFELLGIPYTGADIQSSAMAIDKQLTKQILASHGMDVPRGVLLHHGADPQAAGIPMPVIVKPNDQGSTVGLRFVYRSEDLVGAVAYAFQFGNQVLIEELVHGTEISVPVLGDTVLPIVEIVPAEGRYDFAAKYTPGATEEIIPARINEEAARSASEIGLRAHRVLKCRGASRTDIIVCGDRLVVLEVNTLPGMTKTSLLPNSARAAGIEFEELCEQILREAVARHDANR